MPDILLHFKSEYVYLFSLLHRFNSCPEEKHDYLYFIPNLARRFLEAFLGFKIPRNAGLSSKLGDMFVDGVEREQVWKFINQYSHNTSLPRSLLFPDLSECIQVVRLIIERADEMDPKHFETLRDEIGETAGDRTHSDANLTQTRDTR